MSVKNDKPFFEDIYQKYKNTVYLVAYSILKIREDAEDVTQDVFMSFFQMKEREKIKNLKSYLLTMSHNKALNLLKKRNREELVEDISEIGYESQMFRKETSDSELPKLVEKLINKLPDTERQVFILHFNGELKFREISKIMDVSVSEAYRRYKKAVKILKDKLIKGGYYERKNN